MTNFPTSIDSYTRPGASDKMNTSPVKGTEVVANAYDAIEALEEKVGIDSSADTDSLTYKLESASSTNPGHKHTLASGATDITATVSELNVLDGITATTTELNYVDTTVGTVSASKAVIADANKDVNFGTGDVTATLGIFTAISTLLSEGVMLNGVLSRTLSGNNVVFSILAADGNVPSATNPVIVNIGGTKRTITSALTLTIVSGTNVMNLGGTALATQDVDVFVYLGWRASDSSVFIGVATTGNKRFYSQFSTTNTDWTYMAYSGSAPATTDVVTVIGRANVTLSASGSSHVWTIPSTSYVIQHPVYHTRLTNWVPTRSVASGTAPTYTAVDSNTYYIDGGTLHISGRWSNTSGGTAGSGANDILLNTPFTGLTTNRSTAGIFDSYEDAGTTVISGIVKGTASGTNAFYFSGGSGFAGIKGDDQSSAFRQLNYRVDIPI